MGWESLIPAGMALLGGASSGNTQTTQNRDPWAAAQPWMISNLGLGQQLMNQYMANPLSDYQKQAYANSAQTNNLGRNLTNSLMGQMNGFTGWTRQNPGRVTPYNFSAGMGGGGQTTGNLGFSVNPGDAQKMADLQAQIEALKKAQLVAQSQGYRSNGNGAGGSSLTFGYTPGIGQPGYAGGLSSVAAQSMSPDSLSPSQRDSLASAMSGWGKSDSSGD